MIPFFLSLYLMQTPKQHLPPNPCSNPVKCPASFKPKHDAWGRGPRK
jgi:hypothetical protein